MAWPPILETMFKPGPRAFFGITGDWRSLLRLHFLHAALESGLLEALRVSRTRAELVSEMGVEREDLLDAILDLGVSLGELRHGEGLFELKGARAKALSREENDALAALVEANVTYYNAVFRGFANRLRGGPLDPGVGEIGALVARASRISEPYVERFLAEVVRDISPDSVLDVGCGSAGHLKGVLDQDPEARGVGLEVDPRVVAQAESNLAMWGLADRATIFTGDIRDLPKDLGGPFHLALFFNLAYYFPDEERVEVLRAIRERLVPLGRLALTISCRGSRMDQFSANLNVATTSMEGLTPLPTWEEMESQLREAGFSNVHRRALMPGTTYFGFVAF